MRVIVCTGSEGCAVVIGECDEMPRVGEPCELRDARMLLYWPVECAGLFGFAARGPQKGTRITAPVQVVRCTAREVLTLSSEATKAIDRWPSL